MKYSQIRIALLTFTLGFASIPFFDFAQTKWIESSIDLPKAKSEILVIMPRTIKQMTDSGLTTGGHGGGGNGALNEPVVPKKKKLKSQYKQLNKSR
ncbi:MAG: hypothetical protein ACR2MD_19665 [Aridibacter sp.]